MFALCEVQKYDFVPNIVPALWQTAEIYVPLLPD